MNLWLNDNWKNFYECYDKERRAGIRFRFDKNVNPEVKQGIIKLSKWLRNNYEFPKRVIVYVKETNRIRAKDGDLVVGTFWRPFDRKKEPYVRIATGDYEELLKEISKESAITSIIFSLFHELTHYFQWLNNLNLTLVGEERQATVYARIRCSEYLESKSC